MSRFLVCASLLVACGGSSPEPRGPEPIELECQRVTPVALAVAPDTLATADTPHTFEIPEPLLLQMTRTGKSKFWYSVTVCAGSPPTRGDATHSTGFPDLDQLLDVHLADLHLALPTGGCTAASLIVSGLDRACLARQFD